MKSILGMYMLRVYFHLDKKLALLLRNDSRSLMEYQCCFSACGRELRSELGAPESPPQKDLCRGQEAFGFSSRMGQVSLTHGLYRNIPQGATICCGKILGQSGSSLVWVRMSLLGWRG